ncbi:CpaF family protein [Desulfofalx alkaliphila]|uniref:CpaF family protein n=1 Tax=Desulfofalx alkaliphila TaxID=105483 RepID=UPI00068F1FBA|nr:ATPase, T2SS/T4P/T4SS family [Desulfofalx alkaliphila]
MLDKALIEKLATKYGEYHPSDIELTDDSQDKKDYEMSSIPGLKESDYKKVRTFVQSELRRLLKPEEQRDSRNRAVRSTLRTVVARALIACDIPLGQDAAEKLIEELGNDCLGYGPIEPFFYDREVTEIICNKDEIRVEKHGILELVEGVKFRDEQHIRDVLDRMLAPTGRSISPHTPWAYATLFDGSRLITQIPPLSPEGTMFTIRRFRDDMTIENLLARKSINQFVADFLKAAVIAKQNIIVSGGTGSGKTTMLNCIASFVPPKESIITIENPCELQLQHPFVRKMEARPPTNEGKGEITQAQCIAFALRMRPDRIIVGECREEETLAMLQAMNTGHPGSMSTIHADSAYECVDRLYTLVSQYSTIPNEAIYNLLKTIDFIVQVVRERNGRRRLEHIVEVNGVTKDEKTGNTTLKLNTIIEYSKEKDDFVWVAKGFKRKQILIEDGGWIIK